MLRKHKQHEHTPKTEYTLSHEQQVADRLSYSDTPGKFWRTHTFRNPQSVIRLGEEMEHRQRGYTLVIPHGDNAAVFEVLHNSPFSGSQYYVRDVNGRNPLVASQETFLQQPNLSVADISVGSFGYVKQIIQGEDSLVTPDLSEEYMIELGGVDEQQKAEMHLVNNALRAIHGAAAHSSTSH